MASLSTGRGRGLRRSYRWLSYRAAIVVDRSDSGEGRFHAVGAARAATA
ncbi:hypothetical protein LC55x_5682 [Lysobacter capsici]|nr:hypothetical protein LC55x_5682 [Lysobacter capsici]